MLKTYLSDWKIGYIKPIYKGEDPTQPTNYRGISIMPCLSKVFNSVLNNRLQTYFDINNTIDQSQIGFQPKTRTADHMFVLRTLIEKYQCKSSKLYTCFVDFAKAFDSIIHSVMFYKLSQIGICGPFYNILKSMYEANCIHVKVEDKLTDKVIQEIGLKQGDNLSPNLFKLYINDLSECFDFTNDQVSLDNMPLSCLMYADDLVLLSTTECGLQKCLNKLETYCDKYGFNSQSKEN